MGRRAKPRTVGEQIKNRREAYELQALTTAIKSFFHSIDEDGSGYLEQHEFAVSQVVVAQLAGDDFDAAAIDAFGSAEAFDLNRDGKVSLQEFTKIMINLCSVLRSTRTEIVETLAQKAAEVVSETRRKVSREIRELFEVADHDRSGRLDVEDINLMATLAIELQKELQAEMDCKVPIEEFLSLKYFDKTRDGSVDSAEFVEHFLDFTRRLKIPKKELLDALRRLKAQVADAGLVAKEQSQADLDQIKRDVQHAHDVLDQLG